MPKVLKMQPEKDKRELFVATQFGVTMLHGGVTNFRTQLMYIVETGSVGLVTGTDVATADQV